MIYLDYNATAPLLSEVLEGMKHWLMVPGNSSSVHQAGQAAANAVESARESVARLVGRDPRLVTFVSGATEGNHTYIRGVLTHRPVGSVAVSSIEHPSVRGAIEFAEQMGLIRFSLHVDEAGYIEPCPIPEDAQLISVMAANHETGAIQPLGWAEQEAARTGAKLHVDATQAIGRVDRDFSAVDGLVFSSHKLGGPGGIGALSLKNAESMPPLFTGGSQERGRRAGTVPTAAAVGFGIACEIARTKFDERQTAWTRLSRELRKEVALLGGGIVTGDGPVLSNTTCAVFEGISGESLVQALDLRGICVSSGAACASGSLDPSPVLMAMRHPFPEGGVRFSIGHGTTDRHISGLLKALGEVLHELRSRGEV